MDPIGKGPIAEVFGHRSSRRFADQGSLGRKVKTPTHGLSSLGDFDMRPAQIIGVWISALGDLAKPRPEQNSQRRMV